MTDIAGVSGLSTISSAENYNVEPSGMHNMMRDCDRHKPSDCYKPSKVTSVAAHLEVLREYFLADRTEENVGNNHNAMIHFESPIATIIRDRDPQVLPNHAVIHFESTIATIIHDCDSQVLLNQEMREIVRSNCGRLRDVCAEIATEIANPENADPLFREIATMSRDQLFMKYGFFDTQMDDCHMYRSERRLWTYLMAHVHALNAVIDSGKHNEIQTKRLRALLHRCKMLILVIEYHLLVHVIASDAFTHDEYAESINGSCACEGKICNTAEWRADNILIPSWKNDTAERIYTVVEEYINRCFIPRSQIWDESKVRSTSTGQLSAAPRICCSHLLRKPI